MSGMTPMGTATAPNSSVPMFRSGRRQARDTALAAGVLCVTPTGLALFLLRSPTGSDHGGEWCIPGGGIEDGEDAETAALRELEEETGHILGTSLTQIHQVTSAEDVDFTTFEAVVDEPFIVAIDDEHVGFCWAPLDMPPQPLHPGCSAMFENFNTSQEDDKD